MHGSNYGELKKKLKILLRSTDRGSERIDRVEIKYLGQGSTCCVFVLSDRRDGWIILCTNTCLAKESVDFVDTKKEKKRESQTRI
jgi:hypothetical protein